MKLKNTHLSQVLYPSLPMAISPSPISQPHNYIAIFDASQRNYQKILLPHPFYSCSNSIFSSLFQLPKVLCSSWSVHTLTTTISLWLPWHSPYSMQPNQKAAMKAPYFALLWPSGNNSGEAGKMWLTVWNLNALLIWGSQGLHLNSSPYWQRHNFQHCSMCKRKGKHEEKNKY